MENNKYQHPLGSNGEVKCPVLGCIAPKKVSKSRWFGGVSVPVVRELLFLIISFNLF
jgi:hypothetical protein